MAVKVTSRPASEPGIAADFTITIVDGAPSLLRERVPRGKGIRWENRDATTYHVHFAKSPFEATGAQDIEVPAAGKSRVCVVVAGEKDREYPYTLCRGRDGAGTVVPKKTPPPGEPQVTVGG